MTLPYGAIGSKRFKCPNRAKCGRFEEWSSVVTLHYIRALCHWAPSCSLRTDDANKVIHNSGSKERNLTLTQLQFRKEWV